MDKHLLLAFKTAAELGSITLAANELKITQSAMSKRIALLESELGYELFNRIGRHIELSEAGKALLPRATKILLDMNATMQFMKDFGGEITGPIKIATSHHIGIHRLPKSLETFSSQYPNVRLQLHFIDSEQAISAIINGESELGFITLSEEIMSNQIPHIQHHKLWHDPMQFVVGKHHPLATKSHLTLDDLTDYPALLPDLNTYTTRLLQKLFESSNKTIDIAMTTNHLDAIKVMISVGLGWSVLPETLIADSIIGLPIDNHLSRELGCIHHRERTLSNGARALLQLLRN